MRVVLVANPHARGGGLRLADRAAERLRGHGASVTLVAGGSAAETVALLRRALAEGTDAVAVAGGDGTVSLALQVLAGTGIPLGIIPAGTGNDLALALGLRQLDAEGAADVIAAGVRRTIDAARVTRADGSSLLYATVLACGLDARVNDRANRMRWPRGGSRYTLALLQEFVALRSEAFRLEIEAPDGSVEIVDEDLLMAAVGNSRSYGGGIPMCADAVPDDGMLDVALVRPARRLRLLRLLPRLYAGTHGAAPEVRMRRARAVSLVRGGNAYADGDPVGATPLRIEVVPGAVEVLVP